MSDQLVFIMCLIVGVLFYIGIELRQARQLIKKIIDREIITGQPGAIEFHVDALDKMKDAVERSKY